MTRVMLCLTAFLLVGGRAAAQSDPRLVAAVREAQEGKGDSARSAVDRLLAATPPADTLYPEILYTQAMVANTAADMRRHLQRVVVEYPTSSWVDDALLRLVQMDYATRSFDAAAANLERLRIDYPGTSLIAQAGYWGGRTYFELKDTTMACRWLADGIARAGDLELQRQLGFLYQRCDTRATASADTTKPDSTAKPDTAGKPATARADSTPAPKPAVDSAAKRVADSLPRRPAPAPTPAALYRVQVAAGATAGAADDAASKAEAAGYKAVIIRDRGYYKVRVGEFATRQDAQAAVPKLKAKVGGSPFVVAEK